MEGDSAWKNKETLFSWYEKLASDIVGKKMIILENNHESDYQNDRVVNNKIFIHTEGCDLKTIEKRILLALSKL